MRTATKSEKVLLSILGAVILGGALFFGYKDLNRRQQELNLELATLRADKTAAEVELQQMPLWTKRAKWIRDHEPVMGDEGDTRAQLLATAVKGARDHHLEVLDQSVGGSQPGVAGVKIEADIRLKGTMEALCGWVAEIQQPNSFYGVELFSLKVDQDQKSMICSLKLVRYFRKNSL